MRTQAESSSEHDHRETRLAFEVAAARRAAVHRSIAHAEALLDAAQRLVAAVERAEPADPAEAADPTEAAHPAETAARTESAGREVDAVELAFVRRLAEAAQAPLLLETLVLLAERSPVRPSRLGAAAYLSLAQAIRAADPDGAERAITSRHEADRRRRRTEVLGPLPRPADRPRRPA